MASIQTLVFHHVLSLAWLLWHSAQLYFVLHHVRSAIKFSTYQKNVKKIKMLWRFLENFWTSLIVEGFCASGLSNLTYLGLRRSSAINAEGMRTFSSLINLEKLDLDRCPGIHGGLAHLKGFGSITLPRLYKRKNHPVVFSLAV